VACGLAPLLLWEGFALLYYGFPAPNTAYAKLATGIPRGELVAQGLRYLEHGALVDPLTLLVALLAVVLAVARPCWFAGLPARALALGVVLYLVWVVRIGGDFMAGRFLTLPFLAGVLLLSRVELPDRWRSGGRAKAVVACFAGLIALATVPRFLVTDREVVADSGIADERRAYQSLSLSNRLGRESPPDHPWAAAGDRLRREGRPVVQVAGGIGLLGYYAGDVAHVLDVHGLSDPLLARLPANDDWRVGHYVRTPRRDYVDSLRTGRNLIVDPDLHRYYEKLRLITRGALLDPERLKAIVGMQLGRYDGWLERYLTRRERTASR
jgi:arabinofuranosyltransferase